MKKKDPSITYLNGKGFNVVKLPRAGIEPMYVIGSAKITTFLGPLRKIWHSSAPEPVAGDPQPAAGVSGQQTDALDLSVGLSALDGVLEGFGVGKMLPSLTAAYQTASKVQFTYGNVTLTSIDLFDLGDYLKKGDLDTDNIEVKHYFVDPGAKTFLITDVLKSNSLTVTAMNSSGEQVGVDFPAIQSVVTANGKISPAKSSESSITYTGTPITFGFAVQQIMHVNGVWQIEDVEASGGLSFGVGEDGESDQPRGVLLPTENGDCRVDL